MTSTQTQQQQQVIKALHIRFEGFSAFFKHPLTITGTQVSLPCPPYSTLLGLVSACTGRVISHKETRIGFEYSCVSTDIELEKTDRLVMNNGILKKHPDGQNIVKRYVHFLPRLDLYLTNLDLYESFKKPSNVPSLGRSQDLVWIKNVDFVDLKVSESGLLGSTMIPYTHVNIPSLIIRCPEWFYNESKGYTRIVGPVGYYQTILPSIKNRIMVTMPNLYHSSNLINDKDVIYLHEWSQYD